MNPEQGGWMVGERTMGRFSRKFSRAFGGGNGSRPQSGVVGPASRPVSEVPENATGTAAETHAPEVSGAEMETRGEGSVAR